MDLLKVAADRDRVGDHRAVVEHEHRHRAVGIDRTKRLGELLAIAQVDLFGRQADALFGREDTHAARARGGGAIVEFHLRLRDHPQ